MGFVITDQRAKLRKLATGRLLELAGSMRFAIALLVMLAIASTIGTVVEQGNPYPDYVNQFGPFWADLFRGLGLFDIYGAWWFVVLLCFLLVSIAVCVSRNGPKILADIRSWKDRVHEQGLRAHRLHDERIVPGARQDVVASLGNICGALGYRFVTRELSPHATLVAAKRGSWSRLGYLSSHLAVIVICLGGLLDSDVPVTLMRWALDKSWATSDAADSSNAESHRLASWNPAFRGYAWIPEGQQADSATLFKQGATLAQSLPFSIRLERFRVDYYSTGMPKAFLSDIVVTDADGGKPVHATVSVNKPFTYHGVSIYQSGYQDGGSTLDLTAWPMQGADAQGYAVVGVVGGSDSIDPRIAGEFGQSVEFTDFRAINVEDTSDAGSTQSAASAASAPARAPRQALGALLGSAAKPGGQSDKRNIGPSIQYKVRGSDGQAREFRNFMLPLEIDGARVFLAGVRSEPDAPFDYMRIPVDEQGSIRDWMALRAALSQPTLRAEAARRFAGRTMQHASATERHAEEQRVRYLLDLFVQGAPSNGQVAGRVRGFRALATYLDQTTPAAGRRAAAIALLHTLRGATWDLWQLSRVRNGLPPRQHADDDDRFVTLAVNALSDSASYGAPVFYQLNTFRQVQASILQLTRSPGEPVVFVGSIMLVIGIFAMFYVRERRLWFVARTTEQGTQVLLAMSAMRGTLDVQREFAELRALVDKRLTEPA